MVRIPRYRLRRMAVRYATIAACLVVAAVAVAFFANAVTSKSDGTVWYKEVVDVPLCREGQCGYRLCYQIGYVTNRGDRKLVCLPKERYYTIKVGDHYAP